MIDSAALLADLKRELKTLEADLRVRAEDSNSAWGSRLRDEHERAQKKERTGLAWIDWRDGEVAQAGVAWIIGSVFIRFCEDNGLLVGATDGGRPVSQPWIAAPGDGLERAVENEAAFYAATPTMTSRDWLQQAFGTLAGLPAGGPLVDRAHSAVWHSEISATGSDGLLAFFRRTTPDGFLVHDFSDPDLGTRFLGDLYQDLSDYAKKTYALLQTPVFVEQFILDLTLTPAIKEFGLNGLKVIDPACGSGHFLLGAFDRLMSEWSKTSPGLDKGDRAQRALNSIHGVDLNPFAIAIARFRLTVAAIKAAGIPTLVAAPAFRYHLAIGDSLLGGQSPEARLDMGDGEDFAYQAEDLQDHANILAPGQYHVVVANPPYITVKDKTLNQRYRELYSTCSGLYALSVPFMELLFRLAKRANAGGAGYVGQITSNSFMKREFGRRLIERFLAGGYTGTLPDYVDLSHIIDTSGAYIPGHGTPTVILVGRPRKPQEERIRAVLGIRGEPGEPATPADGLVWREIVDHIDTPNFEGTFVSVTDVPRADYASFPWSLTGGGAGAVKLAIESSANDSLGTQVFRIGFFGDSHADDAFLTSASEATRSGATDWFKRTVIGAAVRDHEFLYFDEVFFPYHPTSELRDIHSSTAAYTRMWPYQSELSGRRAGSGGTYASAGRVWYEWHQLPKDRGAHPWSIAFAFVATHNHFLLGRGSELFARSAPVIKLPEGATEDDHYDLLGVLNSSTACFWLKQVSYPKGGDPMGDGGARVSLESWSDRYEFTATKLQEFPLPVEREGSLARRIDRIVQARAVSAPATVVGRAGDLDAARLRWEFFGRALVALQEELDWRMYVAFGLVDTDVLPVLGSGVVPIEPNERAFEIRLACEKAAGRAKTAWFDRHKRTPLTELPASWPRWYADLVERRLAAIDSNPALRLLEQPDFKRRWAGSTWDELLADAVKAALLDRLEAPELWRDGSERPLARSAAQIADTLRHDERVRELLTIHTGSQDFDLTTEIGNLLAGEAVPSFAPLRYKPNGIEKFRAWQHAWDLQRAEDRGEQVEVHLPPKFAQADFLKQTYWSARGKLDVPKERFLSFPGTHLPDDTSELYGWAGWDYAERGQAIARLANDVSRAGSPDEQIIPLLGSLLELQPWLGQWYGDLDARSGVSPASAISGVTTALLGRLGIGSDTVLAWRPAPATRGRKKA